MGRSRFCGGVHSQDVWELGVFCRRLRVLALTSCLGFRVRGLGFRVAKYLRGMMGCSGKGLSLYSIPRPRFQKAPSCSHDM